MTSLRTSYRITPTNLVGDEEPSASLDNALYPLVRLTAHVMLPYRDTQCRLLASCLA